MECGDWLPCKESEKKAGTIRDIVDGGFYIGLVISY